MDSHPIADRLLSPVSVESVTPREFVNRAYQSERLVVFRYLPSLGIDRDTALDLTQDSFLKMYGVLRRGEQIRNARAWLFATASRLAIDFHRSNTGVLVSGDATDRWLEALPDRAPGPESAALKREQWKALWRAYAALSPQQKVCLQLRAEGYRYREIAEVLDSLAARRRPVSRAITRPLRGSSTTRTRGT